MDKVNVYVMINRYCIGVLVLHLGIKINNNPKVIINVNIKFARSRIRTCEPEGRRLKRRGIDH